MHKPSIAVLIGGLVFMPVSATSQSIASAPKTFIKAEQVLFLDRDARVPPSAMTTLLEAVEASKRENLVRIQGRADLALAVKEEMVRHGAPADRISVQPVAPKPLPSVGDGVLDPVEHKIDLKY
jgi:hypothetical protein